MTLRFNYLPYRRKFKNPLATAHGSWEFREGIVVRLEDQDGQIGFGEIAPVPWFGSETFDEAHGWCREQGAELTHTKCPVNLPCCDFALTSALHQLRGVGVQKTFAVAALLRPLDRIQDYQSRGYGSFKAKVGVNGFTAEVERLEGWLAELHPGQRLRLDANGGFSETDFSEWLEYLEGKSIEFLEQPLAPGLENRMLEMAEPFSTPIALDESIAGKPSLSKWTSWPGPLVVKPSLLGSLNGDPLPRSMVGSSVFETSFGYEAALQFMARHQNSDTALGFGTLGYFEQDGWSIHEEGAELQAGRVTVDQLQALWEERS